MHICSLNMPNEFFSPVSGGAVATVIMQQTRQLLAMGHRATVLTPVNSDELYDVGEVIPVDSGRRESLGRFRRKCLGILDRIHRWDVPYYAVYMRSIVRRLKTLRPDVVILHNDLVSSRYVRKVCPSAAVLVWMHNELGTSQRSIDPTVETTTRFVGVSRHIREWTVEHLGIPAAKVVWLINGTDTERFFPRADYQRFATPVRVLFVGRLDRNKGPDLAIRAVVALQAQGVPVRLTVAGDVWWYRRDEDESPYITELRRMLRTPGVDHLGLVNRNDIPKLMREHDVVCVLSRSNDPCPLVPLEAMASGCAVLATPRGGVPEACGAGAMYVDPENPDDIVSALRRLVTDPHFLAGRKDAAIARARQVTWQSHAARLLQLIEQAQRPRMSEETPAAAPVAIPSLEEAR